MNKIKLFLLIFQLPVMAMAANFSGAYDEFQSNSGTDARFNVIQTNNLINIEDRSYGLQYELNLDKRVNSFPSEAIKTIKSRSSLAGRILKEVNILYPEINGDTISGEIEYVIFYDSQLFGNFEARFVGGVSATLRNDELYVFYKDELKITELKVLLLGRDIDDSSTLGTARLILGLALDLATLLNKKTEKYLYKVN